MKSALKLPVDPQTSARIAGLRYLRNIPAGIQRRRAGKGWIYITAGGRRLTDPEELQRIRKLVIPPMWTNVWISPIRESHLQAIGYDARGRRQYRYHPEFRNIRDATKFHRLCQFAAALPALRRKVAEDLSLRGLPKQKVLAALIRLFDETSMRVGNREYARSNQSYGLTTLTDDHVEIRSERLIFRFKGKSGVEHEVDINDRRLARIIKACQDIPGDELFQYLDENGEPHPIRSEDVNAYIREASGSDLTAKDFRTWNGTCAAFLALRELPAPANAAEAKACLAAAVKKVAGILGNRPATCRKFYIHPAILEAFVQGACSSPRVAGRSRNGKSADTMGLSPEERRVLKIVSQYRLEITETRAKRVSAA